MLNRRSFLALPPALFAARAFAQTSSDTWQFQFPMGLEGRIPGDGVFVMHGYAVENAQYYPGLWHTGENWYALHGDSAGLPIYATAAGEVVFAGYDYPGTVVIIKHAEDLYSQYGHLDYEVNVEVGQQVNRGEVIGTVLQREAPRSHLHFELRNFYIAPEVNGESPRYAYFHCGPNCPPGPGYWPMDAPEHPSAMGWRNPLHVIGTHMGVPAGAEVMVPPDNRNPLLLFASLEDHNHSASVLLGGETRLPLLGVSTGPEASETYGANATSIWFQVEGARVRSDVGAGNFADHACYPAERPNHIVYFQPDSRSVAAKMVHSPGCAPCGAVVLVCLIEVGPDRKRFRK